ncbi:MAG: imidazoleglycerol-phosphate dehydratase HisB [Spirochaetia bacterium]|nr:imidazoleglycerol-phosphate dehydratase HisB [Spirochaetia bacterium]
MASKRARRSSVKRTTKETAIKFSLNIDGTGKYNIKTNEPFLTHMLEQLCRHGSVDMTVDAVGDVEIDSHHLAEDLGITLGEALSDALGDKKGIRRFGSAGVLDEALCRVVLDISGRTYLDYNVKLPVKRIGTFDVELVEEFFNGFVRGAKATLHIDKLKGKNTHHVLESVFKGFALALKDAVKVTGESLPSTKGKL